MTDELLAQVIKKNEMYIDWKTTPITHQDYEKVKFNFKGYEKIVLKGIERAKRDMPSLFTHEGRDLVDSTELANAFNTYYANIGKNLSSQIDQNNVTADYKQYLTSPTKETLNLNVLPRIILSRQ